MSTLHKNPHGNGIIVAEEVHARIHLGQFFSASYVDTSYTNGEVADLVLEVGGITHIGFIADADVNTLFQAYAAPSYSGGTPVTPTNHNQLSSKVSANSVIQLPTVTDPGTFIEDWLAAAGSGGSRGGGGVDLSREFIIGPGNYLFRATNLTANAGVLHIHFNWYETEL